MHTYAHNVSVAVLTFPLVALVVTLPYLVWQYRRYGRVRAWKSLVAYAFVFYLLCACYMVILPLPADRTAVYGTGSHVQLDPLAALRAIKAAGVLDVADPRTRLPALRTSAVYEPLFNVLLTMPFGAFLRYVLKARWWQALGAGLALSLFFELTQLSGLYGIYAHPYRYFDVDDLIANTAGAVLGCWAAAPLCRLLPDLDAMNLGSVRDARAFTTTTHRALAFAVDAVLAGGAAALGVLLSMGWPAVKAALKEAAHTLSVPDSVDASLVLGASMLATGVVFVLVPALTGGRTPGQALLRLRVVRPDGSRPAWWAYAVRYGLLFWGFLQVPPYVAWLAGQSGAAASGPSLLAMLALVYALWLASLLARAALSAARVPFVLLTELMSNTRVMSEEQARALRSGWGR